MWEFDTEFSEVIPRTAHVKSFRFPIRSSKARFQPGQFFFVTMQVKGQEALHHFSFSSSPTDGNYIEFTKFITEHDFSQALDAVTPGVPAHIEGPQGQFVLPRGGSKIVFLTAGIGITPVRSMIRYVKERKSEHNIVLLYSNAGPEDIVFRDELEGVVLSNPAIRVEHILSGREIPNDWKGNIGTISKDLIVQLVPDFRERLFYVSGPPTVVMTLVELLGALRIPQASIRRDSFTGYD